MASKLVLIVAMALCTGAAGGCQQLGYLLYLFSPPEPTSDMASKTVPPPDRPATLTIGLYGGPKGSATVFPPRTSMVSELLVARAATAAYVRPAGAADCAEPDAAVGGVSGAETPSSSLPGCFGSTCGEAVR